MFDGVPKKGEKAEMGKEDVATLLDNTWCCTQEIPSMLSYLRPSAAMGVWLMQVLPPPPAAARPCCLLWPSPHRRLLLPTAPCRRLHDCTCRRLHLPTALADCTWTCRLHLLTEPPSGSPSRLPQVEEACPPFISKPKKRGDGFITLKESVTVYYQNRRNHTGRRISSSMSALLILELIRPKARSEDVY